MCPLEGDDSRPVNAPLDEYVRVGRASTTAWRASWAKASVTVTPMGATSLCLGRHIALSSMGESPIHLGHVMMVSYTLLHA
jgi:hypothetical protein